MSNNFDFCYSGLKSLLDAFSSYCLWPEKEENLLVSLEGNGLLVSWIDRSNKDKWIKVSISLPGKVDATKVFGLYSLANYYLAKAVGLYLHWKQEAHLGNFSLNQPGCKAECLSCKKTSFGICRDTEVKVTNGNNITIHASDSLYGFVG